MCGVQVYQDTSNSNYIGEGVVRRLNENGNEIWTLNYNDPNSTNQDLTFFRYHQYNRQQSGINWCFRLWFSKIITMIFS